MTLTYRDTKGSALTHAEMDANWRHEEYYRPRSLSAGSSTAMTKAAKLDQFVCVTDPDFGALADGSNDTAAIQLAVNYAHDNKIGNVYFPPGTYSFDYISKTFTTSSGARRSVNIVGAGSKATFFQKYTAADTNPFFSFTTSSSIELFSGFKGFTLTGTSKASDGIKLTLAAYVDLEDLEITACDKAVHGLGMLVSTLRRVKLRSNAIGLYLRKSGTTYPNAVWLNHCVINSNSSFGIDYGDGGQLSLIQCDLEQNGTTADTGTGAMIIRSTVGDENGEAHVIVRDTWFEGNDGTTVKGESTSNAIIHNFDQVIFQSDEGSAIDLASGRHILTGVHAPASTIVLAGRASDVRTCGISVLTDTCTYRKYATSDIASSFWHGERAPRVSADNGNAGRGLSVGDNTDVPTQVWNTVLTADRAVTLSTSSADNGAKFRIVRTAAATGAFNLNVGTGPLKALAAGEWCDVEFDGSAWFLTAFGTL